MILKVKESIGSPLGLGGAPSEVDLSRCAVIPWGSGWIWLLKNRISRIQPAHGLWMIIWMIMIPYRLWMIIFWGLCYLNDYDNPQFRFSFSSSLWKMFLIKTYSGYFSANSDKIWYLGKQNLVYLGQKTSNNLDWENYANQAALNTSHHFMGLITR